VSLSFKVSLYKYFVSCIVDVMKSYPVQQFETQFPDDEACLEYIFIQRFGKEVTCTKCGVIGSKFYRARCRNRKAYACEWCGNHIYPLAGTIFHKSSTPLKSWFRAIYNVSIAKNGVSAKEMQRAYGVCYETALRMAHQIKKLMIQNDDPLLGVVEVDEMYFGGKTNKKRGRISKKVPIMGAVERDGFLRLKVMNCYPNSTDALQFLRKTLTPGTTLHTDDSRIYFNAKKYFTHLFVNHSRKEYVKGKNNEIHTNTIEGLWGQFNRAMLGTYQHVEDRYLVLYANEFAFRYNHRHIAPGPVLFELAAQTIK
jgi:transposase